MTLLTGSSVTLLKEMKNKVLITLVTEQTSEESEPETLEIVTEGTLEKTPDGVLVEYDEPDEEMKGSKSSILINSPEHITMTRTGTFNSHLVIEKSVRHNCLYDTPFGSIMMGIFASEVNASFDSAGGTVKMKYTVDFNSSMVSENTVTVNVKNI